jgi:transcriptional regulator with XRE-family HTH domain
LKLTSRQPSHRDQLRREARRPIESWEVPQLERLGCLLRVLRKAAGMTQRDLARSAELSSWMVSQIELGTRRTRRSTLRRIARAIVGADPNASTEDELTEQLVEAAGEALAPESGYRARVDRRRKKRAKRGRYGPRELAPLPGEELRAYLDRLRRRQMLPKRGVCCPTCGQELRAASD